MEMDTTLERLVHVLDAMASKMNPITTPHFCPHFLYGGLGIFQQKHINDRLVHQFFEIMHLFLSPGY